MRLTMVVSVLAILTLAPPEARGSDWPHLRGPGSDGRTAAAGTFSEAFGLKVEWKAPLGSAYSGIAVADGSLVTAFADGGSDVVAAFDAASGKPRWRYRLGARNEGHDGSDDGPLSTPVLGGGRVFALGPDGRLVALRLADGGLVWERRLADFGGEAPSFGYATTPVLLDDVLILQAGGPEGRSIVGLDAATGETRWTRGDDGLLYESPAAMTLAGRRQVVAIGPKTIVGLDPGDGSLLWTHPLGEEDRVATSTPTFIGEDRFLTFITGDAVAFRVSRSETGFAVEELYRSKTLGGTYAQPVYHEGHVYGFRGQVLACMNAETGERVWRSRPPGGDGLILVDGRLVIFAAKGNVVVADATPEGYRERARVQALEGSSLTWPSFAGGRVYVRNLEEMAAVAVTSGGATVVSGASTPDHHQFAIWVHQVARSQDPVAMVDALCERQKRFPIVEGDFVHFLYRGEATDVAIAGSMIDSGTPEPLERVPGTDLFHRTYRLEPGARWEYRFQIDFEEWVTDPRNDRTVPGVEDDDLFSELVTPGYALATHTAEPEGPRGRVESFTLKSEILGYDKQIDVWLPPGYDEGDERYPLLLVNDGKAWIEKGLMVNSLDNLVGATVRPVVVAFVEAYPQWWLEAGGSRTEEYVQMQVGELVPALEQRYRLIEEPSARAVMGNLFYGLSSAYAAVAHPDVFGAAAVQSVYLGLGYGDDLLAMLREGKGADVRFYLDWNRYDERNIDRDWDFAEDSRTLAAALREGGYRSRGGEMLDSGGWGSWRNRTDRVLEALFPL